MTSKAGNPAGLGPEASREVTSKATQKIVNNKAIGGPVVAHTEQLKLWQLTILILESDSELSDAASNIL